MAFLHLQESLGDRVSLSSRNVLGNIKEYRKGSGPAEYISFSVFEVEGTSHVGESEIE